MRGFSEKSYTVANVLPKVTWPQLLEKVRSLAGVSERDLFLEDLPGARNQRVGPFNHVWVYGGGAEESAESVALAPGQSINLRETEVRVFKGDGSNKERGMVVIDNADDKAEVADRTIEGLQRASEFYRIRGRAALNDVRRRSEVTEDQIKAAMHFYLPYFVNEAKFQLVQDALAEARLAKQRRQAANEKK